MTRTEFIVRAIAGFAAVVGIRRSKPDPSRTVVLTTADRRGMFFDPQLSLAIAIARSHFLEGKIDTIVIQCQQGTDHTTEFLESQERLVRQCKGE